MSQSSQAGDRLTGLGRFHSTDKSAPEPAFDLGCDSVHVDVLAGKERARVFDAIDTGGLNLDLLEARRAFRSYFRMIPANQVRQPGRSKPSSIQMSPEGWLAEVAKDLPSGERL